MTCSVPGCERAGRLTRGWCGTHYARWLRNGDPTKLVRQGLWSSPSNPLSETERFWTKVDRQPEGCWIWNGAKSSNGYGQFGGLPLRDNGRLTQVGAHVYAYRLLVGPIPDGLQIDHLCRNRVCVNPSHLEAVTPRVNTLRSSALSAENARKTHCKHGHPFISENTWIHPTKGSRHCRVCMRAAWHRWHAKKLARERSAA